MGKSSYKWTGAGTAILFLIGLGVDMIPNITSWWPAGITWGITSLLMIITIILWIKNRNRKAIEQVREETTIGNPIEILPKMHERMIQLKDIRLSQRRPKEKQVKQAFPFLMDKFGVIKLKDYDKFRNRMYKRVNKQTPKPLGRMRHEHYYVLVDNAREIISKLFNYKDWDEIADLEKIGKWLDERHWGLKELYDRDEQWHELYKSIRPSTLDNILRELIGKHISLSYNYCSTVIITDFSSQWPKNELAIVLYSSLVETLPSLTDVDLALSEILSEIDNRMKEIKESNERTNTNE